MKISTTAITLRDIDGMFRPFEHRKIQLHSRLVMAPLLRLMAEEGKPTAEAKLFYSRRSRHEVGLIITEPVAVDDAAASADSGMAHFFGGEALRAWKGIARSVHASGCKIAPLLCHVGMLRPPSGDFPHPDTPAIGPSGVEPGSLEQRGEPMSHDRMREVAQSFARAAVSAQRLGFDAVAIEGGGACLLEQFLRGGTNLRHDEYGGDLVSRARFACEVLHAVRKAVGSRFPIIFRLPDVWKKDGAEALVETPAELETLLKLLRDAQVDMFMCDVPEWNRPAFPGSPLSMAGWVRMLSGVPVMVSGGIGLHGQDLHPLGQGLRAGEYDLVAVGRALLADAEWGLKVRMAREESILPYHQKVWARLF